MRYIRDKHERGSRDTTRDKRQTRNEGRSQDIQKTQTKQRQNGDNTRDT